MQHNFQHSPSDLERSIAKLGNNKDLGPDEFAAEVAKTGGSAFAVKLYDVTRRLVEEERWPVQWEGVRSRGACEQARAEGGGARGEWKGCCAGARGWGVRTGPVARGVRTGGRGRGV